MRGRYSDEERAGWAAWLMVIAIAIAYGVVVVWVAGMVKG